MNQLRSFLMILCFFFLFFFHVKAQNTSESPSGVLSPLHSSLAAVISIVSIMLSVAFLILAYAKLCRRNTSDDTHLQDFLAFSLSRSRFSGIDRAVIDSLPFFRFSSLNGSKQGLECSVCLSIFQDADILRLLPKCKHAFHKNSIDQWLESHSSCPLCRYKCDPKDLKSLSSSSSLRYLQNPSNLTEDPNFALFLQREQDHHGSSRFNLGRGNKQELHKFKHKIVLSEVITKNRWSDVNSSDLLSLNSEMLSVMSSNRFFPSNSSSAGFYNISLSMNQNIEKIKEDIERKRLYESKLSKVDRSDSFTTSNQEETWSKMINPEAKRSMSEITIYSRFKEVNMKSKIKESSSEQEDRIRRLWLPIARRTVQWFAGRERNLQELQYKRQTSNV